MRYGRTYGRTDGQGWYYRTGRFAGSKMEEVGYCVVISEEDVVLVDCDLIVNCLGRTSTITDVQDWVSRVSRDKWGMRIVVV